MDAWQAVMLGLAALLVGATLPALVQLTLTLRALRATAVRADQALAPVAAAAARLERLAAALEAGGRVERLLDAVEALTHLASQLQGTARVAAAAGAAVGPALKAAVAAWRASKEHGEEAPANGAATPTTTQQREVGT